MNLRLTLFSTAVVLAASQFPLGAAAQGHVPAGSTHESAGQPPVARAASVERARFTDAAAWYLAAGSPQRHFRLAYGDIDGVLADARPTASAPLRAVDSESWSTRIDQKGAADLKAASHGIEGAAAWIDTEAKGAAAAAEKDARKFGATLARDGDRAGQDIVKGYDSLRAALHGNSAGSRVSPFDVGA